MTKTGHDHLNSLRDGRTVYLDGQRIADVVEHPAYRNAVHSVAHLYDFQSSPDHLERLTFPSPTTGNRVNRYYVPNRRLLYAAQVLTQQLYPQMVQAIRELAGGGLIMLPSSVADFANPAIAPFIEKTQKSPAVGPKDRVKLFKLAWDALGSEFGSRHTQYEMFYAGAAFVTRGHAFRTYPWEQSTTMVEGLLARYDLPPS